MTQRDGEPPPGFFTDAKTGEPGLDRLVLESGERAEDVQPLSIRAEAADIRVTQLTLLWVATAKAAARYRARRAP